MSRLSAIAELARLMWDVWRAVREPPLEPRVTADAIRRDLEADDRRAARRRRELDG